MSRTFSTRFVAAVVVCVLGRLPAYAQADPEDILIRQGAALRQQHQDATALERFRQAFAIAHSARASAQVGMAEAALGRWLDADLHLGTAMAAAGDGWIQQNHAALEQARGVIAQHVGHIEVLGGRAGAQVLVNGQPAGTLPLAEPLRALVGTTVLEVRATGYNTVQRNVTVQAGAPARETIDLVPLAPGTVVVHNGEDPSPPISQRGARGPGAGPWVVAGAGVATFAAAAVFYALRTAAVSDRNAACDTMHCFAPAVEAQDRARTWTTLTNVALVGGGALVAGGALWFVLARPRTETPVQAAWNWQVAPSPGGITLGLGGSF